MNVLSFIGKIGFINNIVIKNSLFTQIIFIESGEDKNYIPCIVPHKVLADVEDYIQLGTILEVQAHFSSTIILKDGKSQIAQKIIVDKVSYFSLDEESSDDVIKLGQSFFNDNIDKINVPF